MWDYLKIVGFFLLMILILVLAHKFLVVPVLKFGTNSLHTMIM